LRRAAGGPAARGRPSARRANGVDSSSWVLLRAAAAVAIAIGVGGCESVTDADPPEPARTPPPSQSDGNIAWLGARYGDLGFHSVDQHLRPAVFVNYGDPTPPDPGSGDVWHFPLQVMTAPRRAETRRRLQRSLGAGIMTKLGISYGCRHPQRPRRVAVLTATQRIEITGRDCPDLLRASRHLRRL